jgi:hypothetical protein
MLAAKLHRALRTKDRALLASILNPKAIMTLPGDNQISGVADGVDQVIARAELIASCGPSLNLEAVLVSRGNFALLSRNRAKRGELVLDQRVATVCTISGDTIVAIEPYLCDQQEMNAFFANPPG